MDISPMQLERTSEYLSTCGIAAKLVCSSMESESGVPREYFDLIYAVYSIGWTTDLRQTVRQIYSYLKTGGMFIFSWSHPLHKCVSLEDGKMIFDNCYFDESWYSVSLDGEEIMLSNRKLSTYVNALAEMVS